MMATKATAPTATAARHPEVRSNLVMRPRSLVGLRGAPTSGAGRTTRRSRRPIMGAMSSLDTAGARTAVLARVRRGVRRTANWLQLGRFCAVGATGYVINLLTFALCTHGLDV